MDDVLYENSVYMIRAVPGKGYGLVAARKIPRGTRILSEAPLIRVPRKLDSKDQLRVSIAAKLASFPPNYRKAYLELWNSYEEDSEEVGIALTNALPLGPDSSISGVFLQASRINHGCHPNAQENWNEGIEKLTIHACCDIEEGEEITISYLKKRAGYKTRQLTLQVNCRFRCRCSLCSLPVAKRKLSDARLEEIQRLDNEITSSMVHHLHPLDNLHNVHRILKLMIDEGISDVSIPRAYSNAFLTAICRGDQARAKVFADRALHSRRTVEGNDSPMVEKLEQLSYHPYLHLDHRTTKDWKSNIEDAPRGFSRLDFELWLWRREKPRELQFADLRCTSTFPCFEDLPGDDEAKAKFFEATDAFRYQPKQHWAFLGDILSVDEGDGVNLKLVVEDKNWKKVPVILRTSEFEDKLDLSLVKEGNTVLILFPVKDEGLEGTPGIVVDRLKVLKILPIELEELLLLNDRVLIYSSLVDGKKTCHGCDKKSDALWTCTGCRFFGYCNESCQRRGHIADCKLLRQTDIRGLFRLKEDSLETYSRLAPGRPDRECVVL